MTSERQMGQPNQVSAVAWSQAHGSPRLPGQAPGPRSGDRRAWAYASGLVAARLGRLLDESALAELLEVDDAGERFARVRQTTLGVGLSPAAGWLETGTQLDRRFNERVAELGRACPDATVVDFFGLQEECRLLKRYAKSRLKAPEGEEFGAGASIQGEELEAGWAGEQIGPGRGSRLGWEEALAQAEGLRLEVREGRPPTAGPTAWLVDLMFDGVLLRAELALAEEVTRRWGGDKVAEVIRWWVELQCLLVVARARRWPGRLPIVRRYFGIPVGDSDWLAALYELEGTDAAAARLEWRNALASALGGALMVDEVEAGPPGPGGDAEEVGWLARRRDEVLMEQVRAVRWVSFGPEPVFGYLWGLRGEADNLKAVEGGLQAGASSEMIREQLRPTYV